MNINKKKPDIFIGLLSRDLVCFSGQCLCQLRGYDLEFSAESEIFSLSFEAV